MLVLRTSFVFENTGGNARDREKNDSMAPEVITLRFSRVKFFTIYNNTGGDARLLKRSTIPVAR